MHYLNSMYQLILIVNNNNGDWRYFNIKRIYEKDKGVLFE